MCQYMDDPKKMVSRMKKESASFDSFGPVLPHRNMSGGVSGEPSISIGSESGGGAGHND